MSGRFKLIIIGVVLAVVIVSAILAFLLSPRQPKPVAVISPTPTATATATPEAAPGVYTETHEETFRNDPVLTNVPKITPYWTAEITKDRNRDGKVQITVTVYVKPKEDKQKVIDAQRAFVVGWLNSIGQPPDSYVLQFRTQAPDTY